MSNNLGYPVPTNYRHVNRNPVNQFVSPGRQGNQPLRPQHIPITRQSRVSSIPHFQSVPHNVMTNNTRQSNTNITNTENNLNSNIDIDTNVLVTTQYNSIPNSVEATNLNNPTDPTDQTDQTNQTNPTIQLINDKIVKMEKEYQQQFGELTKMVQTLKDNCLLLETNHGNLSSVLTNIVDELSQNPDEDIVLTQVDNNLDFEMMKNIESNSHLANTNVESSDTDKDSKHNDNKSQN